MPFEFIQLAPLYRGARRQADEGAERGLAGPRRARRRALRQARRASSGRADEPFVHRRRVVVGWYKLNVFDP